MKVEAGELNYNEKDAVVHLGPWSRMTHGGALVNAGESTVKLNSDKKMETVDAVNAKGTDNRPGRQLEYSADNVHVHYVDGVAENQRHGQCEAHLARQRLRHHHVRQHGRPLLQYRKRRQRTLRCDCARQRPVESKPIPDPKVATPDTKIMKSDVLDLHMRPGGKDLSRVNTDTPGTLEFVPNQTVRHRRILKRQRNGCRLWREERYPVLPCHRRFHRNLPLRSGKAGPGKEGRQDPLPVAYTSSKIIDATFDEKVEIKAMKQNGDFRYTEGVRKAQADYATLDQPKNVMDLENHSRISDDSGTTIADHIELQQSTGDFDARGHVSTTRLPDQKKTTSDMLDKDEATQGMADHVISAERNHLIHYIGNAVLWQIGQPHSGRQDRCRSR